jgi:predicted transcriptional regulator
VKTAISIPDEVFRRAERLAKKCKMSRSQLYTSALVRLLEAEPKDEVTRAYDSAFEDDTPDPFTREAARAVLADIEWSDE